MWNDLHNKNLHIQIGNNMSAANNLVGTAGEYYVCAELCRQGYLALLTPKNNPLFDVVVTSPNGTKSVSVQVKTRSQRNKQGWKLGTDITVTKEVKGVFVVLVNLVLNSQPEFYIYEYAILSQRVSAVYMAYMAKPKRDGSARKEVGFRWFDDVSFIEDDKQRKNNWKPIIHMLNGS
jgi:hypothetical protein